MNINGLYQSMAIILIHLRRLLLICTTIYLSGILLRRLFDGRCLGKSTQKLNLKVTKRSSAHLNNWCYLYAFYSYVLVLVVINWSELLRISFSLIWESPIFSSSARIFVTHSHLKRERMVHVLILNNYYSHFHRHRFLIWFKKSAAYKYNGSYGRKNIFAWYIKDFAQWKKKTGTDYWCSRIFK